jgi:23S rRNA pseudouridine2605 synthase
LQKLLAQAGLGSRRQVEEWIRAERISVNGVTAVLGSRATNADDIRLDGRKLRLAQATETASLYLCHRSPGVPLLGEMSERLPRRAGRRFVAVSPMPRIDGGLELLTSDGELAAQLQRAVRHVESEFRVRVRGELQTSQLAAIMSGERDAGPALRVSQCAPVQTDETDATNRWYALKAQGASGKDIRQVVERSAAIVSRIERVQLGGIELPRDLPRGQHRVLDPAAALQKMLPPNAAELLRVETAPRDPARRRAQQPQKGRRESRRLRQRI